MSDIKTHGKPLDLRASAAAKAAASSGTSASGPIPAGQLHGRQVSGIAVLDLRAKPPASSEATPATVTSPAKPLALPKPELALTASSSVPAPPKPAPIKTDAISQKPAATAPEPTPAAPKIALVPPPPIPVTSPSQPSSSSNPTSPIPNPKPAPTPIVAAAAQAMPTPTSTVPQSPLINKFTPNPVVSPPSNDLPGVVAGQIDAMSTQAANTPAPPPPPQSPALQQALAAAKQSTQTSNVLKIGAAVAVIGIMATVVWTQNSPKLAFHNAATKAGIDASLPTYMPSSYHQSGPVSVNPGQLTMAFTSPVSSAIKIIQQQSSWDATSLRDNYISHQAANYLTVQGQGLTIYLYGNQADWINHGVWYQINGISGLSQQQVLKIAYGL